MLGTESSVNTVVTSHLGTCDRNTFSDTLTKRVIRNYIVGNIFICSVVRSRFRRQRLFQTPLDVWQNLKVEKIYQVEVRRAQSEILHSRPDGRIAKRKAELKQKLKRDL